MRRNTHRVHIWFFGAFQKPKNLHFMKLVKTAISRLIATNNKTTYVPNFHLFFEKKRDPHTKLQPATFCFFPYFIQNPKQAILHKSISLNYEKLLKFGKIRMTFYIGIFVIVVNREISWVSWNNTQYIYILNHFLFRWR